MTPKEVKDEIEAYSEKRKTEMSVIDYEAWRTGMYVAEAIGSTFGKHKYPTRPHSFEEEDERKKKELQSRPENIFMSLKVSEINAKLQKQARELKKKNEVDNGRT